MNFVVIFALILLLITLLIGGFEGAAAAKTIADYGTDTDPLVKRAYQLAAGACSLCFIVAFLALGAGVYLLFKNLHGSTAAVGGLAVVLVIALIGAGIMFIFAAQSLGEYLDTTESEELKGAKTALVWGASLSFVSLGLLIVGVGLSWYFAKKGTKDAQAAQNAVSQPVSPAGSAYTPAGSPSQMGCTNPFGC